MLSLYSLAHIVIALLELILLGLSARRCYMSISVAMIVLPIVLVSVSYDNFVLGLGNFIGVGVLLKNLSIVRFFLHYCAVPLFVVVGVELAHRAGAIWANTAARTISWALALGLASTDIFTRFISLNLQPVEFLGVLRYVNSNPTGAPIITIAVNLFMILIGIGLWIRIKWPWLFFGTIIAFIGNAIPINIIGTIIGSVSEFIIAISLFVTEQKTQSIYHKNNRLYNSSSL